MADAARFPSASRISVPDGFGLLIPTVTVSSGSNAESPRTSTAIVLLVSPAAKVSVPLEGEGAV